MTIIAGLATGLGGLIILFPQVKKESFLNFSLAFSGGVMLLVSLVEIFPKSLDQLRIISPNFKIISLISLLFGFALFYILSNFVKTESLKRISILIPLVIIGHNLPEGLLTFLSAMENPQFGLKICIAVALHNIPEGLIVALPVYYSTGSYSKAIGLAFISGIMEVIGALLGYYVLQPYLNPLIYGIIFAIIAGIMIIVSIVELIPFSFQKEPKVAQYGLILGFIVMGIGLGIIF